MTERPILFSAQMVRAILEGRKTQTRRIIKNDLWRSLFYGVIDEATGLPWVECPETGYTGPIHCPYGKPGDRLWVRETHYVWSAGSKDGGGKRIDYRATEPDAPCAWTPSIHMPRWASRINLEVTGIRVERLLDISEEDAQAEGVVRAYPAEDGYIQHDQGTYLGGFEAIWEAINGRDSWAANPWVWVVEFKRA